MRKSNLLIVDGNNAAIHAAYSMSDTSVIYPITPASVMSQFADQWSGTGKQNIWGNVVEVTQMQSEGGVAGALHGAANGGALVSTYTSSQGLLLMIPTIYRVAGEMLPVVFHVASRLIADSGMSIYCDHGDVMACRQTGVAMLSSANVQEAADLAVISHLAAVRSCYPFMHFFDGMRISHGISKVDLLRYEEIKSIFPSEALMKFRDEKVERPDKPTSRSGVFNSDIHWQQLMAQKPKVDNVLQHIEESFNDFEKLTGRAYKAFDYVGAPDAEKVLLLMGSGIPTSEEVVNYLREKNGEKVGVIKVRIFRPFSVERLLEAIPSACKILTVLDKTKETGILGGPLYQEVAAGVFQSKRKIVVLSGQYGIRGKHYTPTMALAVFNNMKAEKPSNFFTVGILDDVNKNFLELPAPIDTVPEGTVQCMFFALGADGTVGANKEAIKMIGKETDLYCQGYFQYDAKKSGGTTISNLRFGKKPISSEYEVFHADYIGCHIHVYVFKFDMLKHAKKGSTFVLNSPWITLEELEANLPGSFKRKIAEKEIQFFNIDASKLARDVGLSGRINLIMQTLFFKLTGVLDFEKVVDLLRESNKKLYLKKGQEIVDMNNKAIDETEKNLLKVEYDASKWLEAELETPPKEVDNKYMNEAGFAMLRNEGNSIPVSKFQDFVGGAHATDTSRYEKRGVSQFVPFWDPKSCIQCNSCSLSCPHAAIRPFILDEAEKEKAPETFVTKPLKGGPKDAGKLQYRIQVSPLDCVSCELCTVVCPKNCLTMTSVTDEKIKPQAQNWEYAVSVKNKGYLFDPRKNPKFSQFQKPLLEFSGACAGCTETQYVKLLTQIWGDRLMLPDSCGCSLVWSAPYPSSPYSVDEKGVGPVYMGTLFEDTAEFGYGVAVGAITRRMKLVQEVKKLMGEHSAEISKELRDSLAIWQANPDEPDKAKSRQISDAILDVFKQPGEGAPQVLKEIWDSRDLFIRKIVWTVGGDGWAYDIGYGGLDHVLSMDVNVNILVLDTEVYSNTGGQKSKATPRGAVCGFASLGRRGAKKDLGLIAMKIGNCYVGQVSIGANPGHTLKTLLEAEAFDGPSLVISYCPCIAHGIKAGLKNGYEEAKLAVETGYWPLFNFNPKTNEMKIVSKPPKKSVFDLLKNEVRFQTLLSSHPELATELQADLEKDVKKRLKSLEEFKISLQ